MSQKFLDFISYAPHLLAATITLGQDDFAVANGLHAADFIRNFVKARLNL